jgi:hypothetical protein
MIEIPLTVQEAAAKLRADELTSVALTEAVFARADELDSQIGTYLARFDESALASAAQADAELAGGVDRVRIMPSPLASRTSWRLEMDRPPPIASSSIQPGVRAKMHQLLDACGTQARSSLAR